MNENLSEQYRRRFAAENETRQKVWAVLIDAWFHRYVDGANAVLDLGCGWGPFINQISAPHRYGIDLNPDAKAHLDPSVELFEQRADTSWPLADESLDLVFTSNFLEHLPDREAMAATLAEAYRTLRPGGRLVCLGHNIARVGGMYWDFFDHMIPLTERSVVEAAELAGFSTEEAIGSFLPYTMAGKPPPPAFAIRAYLKLRPAWRLLGKQFLVVAVKPNS
ncbi:MAG: class I SAM-dependent methyltransferase [Acidimicrobiales bacterium]|nr:class I SAM-dependent methyltransferase [Acidimicrobiales bacterium]